MRIPISLKLKKRMHKDVAYAQDLIVEELYNFFPKAVIHGGTAIWRCYGGNRFSEDIDVYIKKDKRKIDMFFESLKKKGFTVIKKRIKENSLYSVLRFDGTMIGVEAIFKKVRGPMLKDYETSEGIFINIYTLPPEDLIGEKVEAYLKRKKIRDLYDIFFLLRCVEGKKEKKVVSALKKLVENFKIPEDEENLGTIIISGIIPTSKDILEYIKRWAK